MTTIGKKLIWLSENWQTFTGKLERFLKPGALLAKISDRSIKNLEKRVYTNGFLHCGSYATVNCRKDVIMKSRNLNQELLLLLFFELVNLSCDSFDRFYPGPVWSI